MAKKRQFKGAKYKDGILSYNYLGGKGGKGGGDVSIKKQGDNWYFVDEDGKIRTDVGDGGKLTPTHMKNLENDGIFDAVPKAEVPDGPKGNVDSDPGGAKPPVELAESNYELPGEMSAPVSKAQKAFTPGDPAAGSSSPITASTENAPPTLQSGWGGETARYNKKMIGSGYSENTQYIPSAVSLPKTDPQTNYPISTNPNTAFSPANEYTLPQATDTIPSDYTTSSSPFVASTPTQYDNSGYTFPTGEGAGQMSLRPDRNRVPGDFESVGGGGALPTQNTMENMKGPGGYSNFEVAATPYVDSSAGGLVIGEGGDRGLFEVDDDFYRGKDGQLMKDAGWWGDDTVATQADIDAGIKDQASPGMTSAAGWEAAGSVMKGVGGLASAYTGIKNYQLARDAHATQKNQWQANYDQRLKAYGDNKKLMNEEIKRKNRTLKARGQAESYQTI